MLVFCIHVSCLESLVFLWRRRVHGGSCKTFPFQGFSGRLSRRFVWQAWRFVTFQPVLNRVESSFVWLPRQCTPHFTLYTSHSTLYTPHSALRTPHFTLHTPCFTLHTPHFTLYTPHSTFHTLYFTLYTPHLTLHTLHSTLDTVHFTPRILHSTL